MGTLILKTHKNGSPVELALSVEAIEGAPRAWWPRVIGDVLESPLSNTLLHISGFHIYADHLVVDVLVPSTVEDVDAFRLEAREAVRRILLEAASRRFDATRLAIAQPPG